MLGEAFVDVKTTFPALHVSSATMCFSPSFTVVMSGSLVASSCCWLTLPHGIESAWHLISLPNKSWQRIGAVADWTHALIPTYWRCEVMSSGGRGPLGLLRRELSPSPVFPHNSLSRCQDDGDASGLCLGLWGGTLNRLPAPQQSCFNRQNGCHQSET